MDYRNAKKISEESTKRYVAKRESKSLMSIYYLITTGKIIESRKRYALSIAQEHYKRLKNLGKNFTIHLQRLNELEREMGKEVTQ